MTVLADRAAVETYVGLKLHAVAEALGQVENNVAIFPAGLPAPLARALSFAKGTAPGLLIVPDPPTAADHLKALAALRWQKSQTFNFDGVDAALADSALAAVTGFVVAAQIVPPEGATVWKLAQNEFRLWTFEQVVAYGIAIRSHIQACFDREETLTALIVAADEPWAVDITSGWPT